MTQTSEADAELLQDRLELLRLRTLLVGAVGMVGLVAGLVALLGYGSQALKLVGQSLASNAEGIHIPANLFQVPDDEAWARSPVLLQLAFVAIGIAGIAQMTRQVLGTVQVRLWLAVLCGLALGITYMQSDFGSLLHSSQRELVKAVRAKEWARVEQLTATSRNWGAQQYVMAQVGLVKGDANLLQLHGKVLVDRIDDMLMRRGQDRETRDNGLLAGADAFNPRVLQAIDLAVYGAPHTQIGLSLAPSSSTQQRDTPQWGWTLVRAVLSMAVAAVGIGAAFGLLMLWRRMTARLRRLRPWIMAV
ncbi:MAG: hypothetical protein V4627_19305 [Pseudomonadota bacterium]